MKKQRHVLAFLGVIILCSYTCRSIQNSAREPHRPYVHFTPPAQWMNDPNGMVYYEGEYHLFYQHYPDSTVWGPMHWGHAVSPDLVRWKHLPIALYPDSLGLIFSGSAVVDWKNTSGFGKNGQPPLVAIFTHHLMEGEKAGRADFQYQSIAYSTDKGRTWTKYAGNPVIPNTEKIKDFRDPKVIWDAASDQWVMVFAAGNHVKIWGSKNLKQWKHLSDFGQEWGTHGGVWECPDLFPIRVEGTDEQRWVLLQSLNPGGPNGGSGTQYFIGQFDGKSFVVDPEFQKSVSNGQAVWLDWGRDNYAGVTWSDIPRSDGRRLFLGWMSNWDYAMKVPTDRWRSAMTIPRELTLHKTQDGFCLQSKPAREMALLRKKTHPIAYQKIGKGIDLRALTGFEGKSFELILEIAERPTTGSLSVTLSNELKESYSVTLDFEKSVLISNRTTSGKQAFSDKFAVKTHQAPMIWRDKGATLHLIVDVASCEAFVNDGAVVLTDIFFPNKNFDRIQLNSNKAQELKIKGMLYNIQ